MSIRKYLNKNKIGAIVLIIIIVIAFGFGGFGGGFLSNNQNNIAKINKTNITKKDLINYINQNGISQKAIEENLEDNIIEELLSGLISSTLLNLEIKDFNILYSENSLSKNIRANKNFIDEEGNFQRIKYEKFLLENNLSAPFFEKRLKDRQLQKKLFDFIGSGTVSPEFLVSKLFEDENKKLQIEYFDLDNVYKAKKDISDKEFLTFIEKNKKQLEIEYIDFRYSIINPKNLLGLNEFNQEFFDKIDEIENNVLNNIAYETIISKFDLNSNLVKNYRYLDDTDNIEKKIYEGRNNKFDIFENKDDFILYEIISLQKKNPDINDEQIKNEILELITQKNKFEYNRELIKKINNENFSKIDFLNLGKSKIQSLTLNSIKDNNKFEINSIKMLYSLPENSFALINDENNKIYLAKVVNYENFKMDYSSEEYKSFISKENTKIRNNILKSYDYFLNDKYKVDINQLAINNVKNMFQ